MRDRARLRILKGALGFFVGLGVWAGFVAPYASAIARTSEPLIRLFERPAVTRLEAIGSEIVINRSDLSSRSAKPAVKVEDLTFNVIFLIALFFSNRQWISNRNVVGLGLGLISLVPIHLAAFIVNVESIYATRLGAWSDVHYNRFEQNLWATLGHFYSFVGVFASAFLIWWILSPREPTDEAPKRRRR